MAGTIFFFRDVLTIDQNLLGAVGAQAGDTVVFGGRQVTLAALNGPRNYVIAADQLKVLPNAAGSAAGTPAITVLAQSIDGALAVVAPGIDGADGADGDNGESGIEPPDHGGKPIILPGGNGGNGGAGGNGGNGAKILIRYAAATATPTGTAPGGAAGKGGRGGAGGAGKPPGKPGKPGRAGRPGVAGTIDIAQVAAADVFKLLDTAAAQGWAAYRAEVAGFFFRKFDPESQIFAFQEARAALQLDSTNGDALAIRDRIANRQTPSGLARDLDIAPDFRGLSANLPAEIALVQNAFQAYVSVVSLQTIADSIRDSLQLMSAQLADRQSEALTDAQIAQQDVAIAQADVANIDFQLKDIQQQIDKAQEDRFSIGGILSDVGSIAGVVAGLATGVGGIVSVAGGLASLARVTDGSDLLTLFQFMSEKPDPNSQTSEDVEDVKKLGGGMKDLIEGGKSLISFAKVLDDLAGAMDVPGQDAIGALLKQQTLLTRQRMVSALRVTQAQSRVAAAQQRATNFAKEIAQVQTTLARWTADEAALGAATDLLIRAARGVVDVVMEDVFLAQRAREIYELDRIPAFRFDFGFLHPDVDRSLTPATRASSSLTSLSGMAVQVLAWDQIYQQLNTAQIGFDIVHPQLSVDLTDAAKLQAFANGATLEFSIGIGDLPDKIFEQKVNALSLEMTGASSAQSANIWITHSGQWQMKRRTDGSVTDFLLLPRSELFACNRGQGTLTAKIPANPQSSSEPGPPFSFWGRGVAATYRLQVATPTVIDLSQLRAIHLTVDCIGYAAQGGGAAVTARVLTPAVRTAQLAAPVKTAAGNG